MSGNPDGGSRRRLSDDAIARARKHTRTGRPVVASDASRSRLAASLRRLGADEATVTDLLTSGDADHRNERTSGGQGTTASAPETQAARAVVQ